MEYSFSVHGDYILEEATRERNNYRIILFSDFWAKLFQRLAVNATNIMKRDFMKSCPLVFFLIALLALSGCAPSEDELYSSYFDSLIAEMDYPYIQNAFTGHWVYLPGIALMKDQ